MHTLAAYGASITNGTVYGQVVGVADGALTRDASNNYIMPANMQLLAAFVVGANLTAVQLQAPSLRNIAYPEIYPVEVAAPTAIPTGYNIREFGQSGPRLVMNESLGVYVSVGGAAPAVVHAGLWLTDRYTPAPPGMVTTLVATATITAVAQAWVLGTLAFNTQLAAGEYAVVGMDVKGTQDSLARLVFPGSTNFRPGCVVNQAYGNRGWQDAFRMGRMGLWGSFVFNSPPQLEVFGHTAGADSLTVYLDVVKTR